MHRDHNITAWTVEFFTSNGDHWTSLDLASAIFGKMTWDEKKTEEADRLRKLIREYESFRHLSVTGTLKYKLAEELGLEAKRRNPDMRIRLVNRVHTRTTFIEMPELPEGVIRPIPVPGVTRVF